MPHIHELYDFTASAYILNKAKDSICLHKHKKLGSWFQPGGHIELHENPIESLQHELAEELGWTQADYEIVEVSDQPQPPRELVLPLPVHFNVHNFGDTNHKHIDLCFLVQAKREDFAPQEGESQEIEWFNSSKLQEFAQDNKIHASTLETCMWIIAKYGSPR